MLPIKFQTIHIFCLVTFELPIEVDSVAYLVKSLIAPVRIDLCQLGGETIVLAHKEDLHGCQHGLLVDAEVSGNETEKIATGSSTVDIGIDDLWWQKILVSQLTKDWVTQKKTTSERSERESHFFVRAVDETCVQEMGDRVESDLGSC